VVGLIVVVKPSKAIVVPEKVAVVGFRLSVVDGVPDGAEFEFELGVEEDSVD
jgi:hypothetical protein